MSTMLDQRPNGASGFHDLYTPYDQQYAMAPPMEAHSMSPMGGMGMMGSGYGGQDQAANFFRQLMMFMQAQKTSPHLAMSGNMIDPSTGREIGNPFDTGFFVNRPMPVASVARQSAPAPMMGGNPLPPELPQEQLSTVPRGFLGLW